jgi:hypothetical protein
MKINEITLQGLKKEPIGLKDRDGREILEGDLVEFSVDYDLYENPTYDKGTKMRDLVIIQGGVAYFYCAEVARGSFAWRHNEHCRVVGSKYEKLKS